MRQTTPGRSTRFVASRVTNPSLQQRSYRTKPATCSGRLSRSVSSLDQPKEISSWDKPVRSLAPATRKGECWSIKGQLASHSIGSFNAHRWISLALKVTRHCRQRSAEPTGSELRSLLERLRLLAIVSSQGLQ